MKKILTLLLFLTLSATTFATYEVPMSYKTWQSQGNYFWAGFEGWANYINWLSPEDKADYLAKGEFKEMFSKSTKWAREFKKRPIFKSYKVIKNS